MYYKLKFAFLSLLYKLFIFKIIIIPKEQYNNIINLKEISRLIVETTHGDFTFHFFENRRKKRRYKHDYYVRVFIVEIEVPERSNTRLKQLNDKLVISFLILANNINYKVLCKVLLEKCLDKHIDFISITN